MSNYMKIKIISLITLFAYQLPFIEISFSFLPIFRFHINFLLWNQNLIFHNPDIYSLCLLPYLHKFPTKFLDILYTRFSSGYYSRFRWDGSYNPSNSIISNWFFHYTRDRSVTAIDEIEKYHKCLCSPRLHGIF